MAKRYIVSRVRHVIEAASFEANSEAEAIEKARKSLKKDWKEIDSKRRRAYKAEHVDPNHTGATR